MFTLGLKETCGSDVTSFAMAIANGQTIRDVTPTTRSFALT
jgi:hypothetical protein